MSQISITFATPTNPDFKWLDSLRGLREEEIEEIIIHLHGALAAFFAELTDRDRPWEDSALEDYFQELQKKASEINRGGLSEELNWDLLPTSPTALGNAQPDRRDTKIVRQFIWQVSRVVGWAFALLVLLALDKPTLLKLNEYQRVKLLKHIGQHRASLHCPALEDKATQAQLEKIRMSLPHRTLIPTDKSQSLRWNVRVPKASKSASTVITKMPSRVASKQHHILEERILCTIMAAGIALAAMEVGQSWQPTPTLSPMPAFKPHQTTLPVSRVDLALARRRSFQSKQQPPLS